MTSPPAAATAHPRKCACSPAATFDLAAPFRGSAGIGYVRRTFDNPVYRPVDSFVFDARVEYFLSPITTMMLVVRSTVEDATIVGSAGYLQTSRQFRIDHELLRNLLLNARLDYETADFWGVTRKDRLVRAGIGADYLPNRRLGVNLAFWYASRTSRGFPAGQEFDEARVTLSTTLQI
jgi:Uncharacterized protein conserved in bacteria